MKKTLKQVGILITVMVIGLTIINFTNTSPDIVKAAYSDILEGVGESVEILPGYDSSVDQHAEAYDAQGLGGITSAIYYVMDFAKYILGGLAVLFMIISAYRLLMAGEGSDEEINKQKEYFQWAIIGLILIFMADTIVKEMFFGTEGEILSGDTEQALEFGDRANKAIKGLYTLIEIFVGAVAVWAIAYDGFRMVAGSYSEEETKAAKNHVFWSVIGLMMIGLSELIVKDILFRYTPGEGIELGISQGKLLFAGIANFLSGLIGLVSVAMLIYGGYLYLTGGVSEENTGKAKKIIISAITGIILAGAAFAIASTIIPVSG